MCHELMIYGVNLSLLSKFLSQVSIFIAFIALAEKINVSGIEIFLLEPQMGYKI